MESIKHYIILLMREAGLQVDSDTYSELDEARDEIDQLTRRLIKVETEIAWLLKERDANHS